MSTVADKLLTAEEYARLPDNGRPTELLRGRVVEMSPPNRRHGQLCVAIVLYVGQFLKDRDLGHVICNDAGVITERDPDTVRGPDVSYYSFARAPRGKLPPSYGELAPEIAFEVRSPSDRWPQLVAKAGEYLAAGALAVCILDDATSSIHLLTAAAGSQQLGPQDDLTFPEILPGFRVRVGELFGD